MRVLIGCEASGVLRREFASRGHDAWSCDVQPAEDGSDHHIQGDVLEAIGRGWDLLIAHPPCTYLCASGLHWNQRPEGIRINREQRTIEAIRFAETLWAADIEMIGIENPKGCLATRSTLGQATQMIQPYEYGEDAAKETYLWLKNLPRLRPTKFIEPRWVCCGLPLSDGVGKYGCPNCCGEGTPLPRWSNQTDSGQNNLSEHKDRARKRSRTYEGIAKAMAEQWGDLTLGTLWADHSPP